MSITVRSWSPSELGATRTDKWLATLLMNKQSLNQEEMNYYPYSQRRTYICEWEAGEEGEQETVTIYATGERMLLKFIDAEYTKRPDFIYQQITQYRPVRTS